MIWRLIEQETYGAAMNMAIDQAIYESVANGRENPTIRFYKWNPGSVSIGAYQNPKDIDMHACKRHKIDVVRRMTGGSAVFHDKNDFTYSAIAPLRIFGYSIKNAYNDVCSCIINALGELGIKSFLENKNDIMVDGKKISGNASKLMNKGVYLQHGTLIYGIDFQVMQDIFNIPEDLLKQKVTSVVGHKKISQQKIYKALKRNFTLNKDFKAEELSKYELMRAEDLAKTTYSTISMPGSLLKDKGFCYVGRG